jgi:hypothetical protein
MIYTNLDNFYVSKESLERSPSRQDGVSEDTETELRIFGATLIQAGGCLLQLPQVVMATGQVLFHRFFCKESMAKFDVEVRTLSHVDLVLYSGFGATQTQLIACFVNAESGLDMLLACDKAGRDSTPCAGCSCCLLPPAAQAARSVPGTSRLLWLGAHYSPEHPRVTEFDQFSCIHPNLLGACLCKLASVVLCRSMRR